jgi:hypothetical protein
MAVGGCVCCSWNLSQVVYSSLQANAASYQYMRVYPTCFSVCNGTCTEYVPCQHFGIIAMT